MSNLEITGIGTSKPNYSKMIAVVVDNIDSMRGSIANILMDLGFGKVYQAKNGLDVIHLLTRTKLDLIVSDWQMPKMDGIQLLKKLRKDPKTSHIPFIMASATVEHAEVVHAVKCGVSEYVVKPFSPKMLAERIERAIANPVKALASKEPVKANDKVEKEPIQILVVDDVPDNIQVISGILKDDYKVRAVTDGEKAIKVCKSANPPDLILLDIMMPGMNGLEVCKRLKANPLTAHITIIFLTALDQTKDIVLGFELGAVDYITKPVNPPVVKARVKTHSKLVDANKNMRLQIDTLIENARLKEEFDRVMQNDLKQPVEEAIRTLDLINRYSKDPNRVKQGCESMLASCNHMQQLIDNMLLLSKLEDGSYDFDPIVLDFHKITEQATEAFKTSYSNKRLEIHNEIESGTFVHAEELLCLSLFNNLLQNAIEAAPRGSAITLSTETNGNNWRFSILNKGMVPEEIQHKFFGKYVSYGKTKGSGIGTYAAKLMTEVQKGQLTFETSEDDGTKLTIQLPKVNR